jgi:hypothetical protein
MRLKGGVRKTELNSVSLQLLTNASMHLSKAAGYNSRIPASAAILLLIKVGPTQKAAK